MQRAVRSICLSLVLVLAATAQALAQPATPLSLPGWWIALDNVFPLLWNDGTIVPMEELLIVDDKLRFENRMMGFYFANPEYCLSDKSCSDAPLVARGQLKVTGNTLSMQGVRLGPHRIASTEADPIVRVLAVSGTRSWRIESQVPATGPLVLRSADGIVRRFYKVEPNRLRRLRAGFITTELTARKHWRCWIAAATGVAEPGFRPDANFEPLVEAYTRIASYRMSAIWQGTRPMPDDPDPQERKFGRTEVEEVMFERFDDLPRPKTIKEQLTSRTVAVFLRIMTGEVPQDMRAALEPNFSSVDADKRVTPAEIAALKLLVSDSPESKRLFCKS